MGWTVIKPIALDDIVPLEQVLKLRPAHPELSGGYQYHSGWSVRSLGSPDGVEQREQ
jgi:hypothetical protein